jgi:glycosyltransferase involved in cell wall biosynthesis
MKMRIGWFIPFQRSYKNYNRVLPSVWIRCLQLIAPLRSIGCDSVINRPWASMDIAMFLRVQGSWAQQLQRFLRQRGVKTIFSAVVNYYEREGNTTRIRHSVHDDQIQDCIAMSNGADAVVTASRFLMERARRHNPNVIYIPDTVMRSHFCLTKSPSDFEHSPLTLIWAGHSVKAHFIDSVCRIMYDLPVKLTIIADRPPDLAMPFTFVEWCYETFPSEILKGDICISPRILDNSYDQAHSNFKIMVFLAQGVPALVSPQDSYTEVIQDGYNGFVCHSSSDWRKHLEKLIANRSLLQTMSVNSVESAQPYLTENILSRYDTFFQRVSAGEWCQEIES